MSENKVIAGHYKNNEILLKGENADQLVLHRKNFFSKAEIVMDKTTIKQFTHSFYSSHKHEVIIEWKDGKISQAIMDDTVYSVFYIKIKGEGYLKDCGIK